MPAWSQARARLEDGVPAEWLAAHWHGESGAGARVEIVAYSRRMITPHS